MMKKENRGNENIVGIFVILILASIFVMPVLAQSSSIPIKLDLTVESSTISVGEKATITVRLLDENDKPVVTEIDVPVNLSTNLGHVPSSVIIHAKTNLSETEFRSGDPGIAVISAKSEGLIGDTTSIAVTSFPLLHIVSPSDGETVDTDTITVSGSAMGTEGAVVESVTVNDVQAGSDNWRADISLDEGGNDITVVATTDMGQSSSETITVYYQAPITPPTQLPRYDGAPSAIPTPTPSPTVSISITTIPPGAGVRLDDFFKGITPTLVNVTVGSHKIEVTKEGYHSHSETKRIRFGYGEPEEMIIELKPLTGSIFVYSTPPGASVYLDDVYKRDTNCTLSEVAVGPHSIKLTKSGYFDLIRTVSVSVGETLTLHKNLTGYGSLSISSDPSGAEVYLDGNYKGETPKNISKVVVGNHTIKLTKFGYDDVIRNVSVSAGETLHLYENLRGYGSLSISSNPSGVRVYLDGNYTEVTPLYLHKLDEGNHSIRLTKRSYKDVTQEIHVSAGRTTPLSVALSPTLWMRRNSPVMLLIAVLTSLIAIIEFIWLVRYYKK